MPSGRTHDSITLWSLPIVAGLTFERTRNPGLTLIVSGGFLFSGLMFGPDLDTYSHQYKRWGLLRWIWLPYRQSIRHRAFLSHGPIVGTVVRLVYLLSWVGVFLGAVMFVSAIAYSATGETDRWSQFSQQYWNLGTEIVGRSLQDHLPEWLTLGVGLELGAMSHSLSDWLGSRYKRQVSRRSRTRIVSHQPTERSPRSVAPPTVELPPLPPQGQRDSQLPPFR